MSPDQCLKLMDSAPAVYLATVDAAGRPGIRAMVNVRQIHKEPGFAVYFGTTLSSAKVRALLANPNAAAYFCDPATVRGLMLAGRMEMVPDPELKRKFWRDDYRIYYSGPDDPEWVVLRLVPDTATGWSGTKPFSFDPR